jgi:two-component system response regulator QseB
MSHAWDPMTALDPAGRSKLLLIEDDQELCGVLTSMLFKEGYLIETAADGHRGLHLGSSGSYDVMVVDRGLPSVDGIDLVRTLRRRGVSTPVIVLTGWGTPADRVEGLDAGAEDYLVKPFDFAELSARLRALRRRHRETAESLPLGPRTFVPSQRRVSGPGVDDVQLSGRECDLLEVFARCPYRIFDRDELVRRVFGENGTAASVDTYVHYLRRKLGRNVIRTIRGGGYRLGSA